MPMHALEQGFRGDEDCGPALAGQGRGQVGAPHLVDPLGSDGAVVRLRTMRPPYPAWRLEPMLPGQAQDAALGGADPGEAQPRPDLPIALAVEWALGQQLADRLPSSVRFATLTVHVEDTDNRTWIVERHGYRTPAQVRADQLGLAQAA
jgi:hypothetical protein